MWPMGVLFYYLLKTKCIYRKAERDVQIVNFQTPRVEIPISRACVLFCYFTACISFNRYAMSVIWELDQDFEVVNVWYGKTIIRSSYKLFYEVRGMNFSV
jgi:hypothetical protein